MKKILLALFLVAITASSCDKILEGSDNSSIFGDDHGGGGSKMPASGVPSAVKFSFNGQFPTASAIEWKLLSNGNYKAQFISASVKWEVTYTPAGVQVKLEQK